MKIYICLIALLLASGLLERSRASQPVIEFLDHDSQTNLIIYFDGDGSNPCPVAYTNILANTNLFTDDEIKMLPGVILKYSAVTTNTGPQGSVLAVLKNKSKYCWQALFKYTNSDAADIIDFWGQSEIEAKHIDKNGNGYEVELASPGGTAKPDFTFTSYKNGKICGLFVNMTGNGHCLEWVRYTNGLAFGKWLKWSREDNGLSLKVQFKTPYDIRKNMKYPQIY